MSILIPAQFFLPHESLQLGRFDTNVKFPHESYHDAPIGRPDSVISPRSQFNGAQQDQSNRSFSSALTSLMSAGFSKRARAQVEIISEQVKIYTIDNSESWFETAVESASTRKWMERQMERGKEMYMVVGFCTVKDACIVQHTAKRGDVTGQIGIPATLTLAAAGAIAPLGNLADATISGVYQQADSIRSQFVAPGEQICGIQYRRVHPKWLSSKAVGTRLSKTRWKYFSSGVRRNDENDTDESEEKSEGDDEEDDIIEVELEECGIPDGQWKVEELPGVDVLHREAPSERM